MWGNFDIYKFAALLLPPLLRRKKLYALLAALICYLNVIYTSFKSYVDFIITTLQTNGQVMYMEKALNDRFYFNNREIYITEEFSADVYMSLKKDDKPLYLYNKNDDTPVYLKNITEEVFTGEFIVNVPDFLKDYDNDINNIVVRYKPAGKMYKIIYYSYG